MISQIASPLYIAGDIQEFLLTERPTNQRVCDILEEVSSDLEALHTMTSVISRFSYHKAIDNEVIAAYNVYRSAKGSAVD